MDCEGCTNDLTAYLDGELSEAKVTEIKTHLSRCEPCHEEYRTLELSAHFVETHAVEVPIRAEIWNSVQARIAGTEAAAPAAGLLHWVTSFPWVSAAATALATVVITLGVWGYMRHMEAQRDLMQYMTRYIHAREVQEEAQQIPAIGSPNPAAEAGIYHSEYADNPFVTVQFTSDTNPFRSEDQ